MDQMKIKAYDTMVSSHGLMCNDSHIIINSYF